MQYLDRLTLMAPEGVDLDLDLAGLGSRLVAAVIDQLAQVALLFLALVVIGMGVGALGGAFGDVEAAGNLLIAAIAVVAFAIQFGYHVAFEVLADGVTPGKRLLGLQVVRASGQRIDAGSSAARNVLRIVDSLPGVYLVGAVAVLTTATNQRLGDQVAGTLVIRKQAQPTMTLPVVPPPWDIARLTEDELMLVRRFMARRDALTPRARVDLAVRIASRLRPKVPGSETAVSAEVLLAGVLAAKERGHGTQRAPSQALWKAGV